MTCSKERATLIEYQTRRNVAGSTQVARDDWMWALKIIDAELEDAQVLLTAKSCIEDPDEMAEIRLSSYATGSSAVTQAIEVLESSTANRLDAIIRIPNTKTDIEIMPSQSTKILYFDIQIIRNGTPSLAPKRQTYFRSQNAHFNVIRDITMVVPGTA